MAVASIHATHSRHHSYRSQILILPATSTSRTLPFEPNQKETQRYRLGAGTRVSHLRIEQWPHPKGPNPHELSEKLQALGSTPHYKRKKNTHQLFFSVLRLGSYFDSLSVILAMEFPDPVGSMPIGILITTSQSFRSMIPFISCKMVVHALAC